MDPYKRRAYRAARLLSLPREKRNELWMRVNKRSLKNLGALGNRTFVQIKAMIETADQIEALKK